MTGEYRVTIIIISIIIIIIITITIIIIIIIITTIAIVPNIIFNRQVYVYMADKSVKPSKRNFSKVSTEKVCFSSVTETGHFVHMILFFSACYWGEWNFQYLNIAFNEIWSRWLPL